VPLIVRTTPANTPDGKMLVPLLDAMPCLHGRRGRPRNRPRRLIGDAAYGSLANRVRCALRSVVPVLAAPRKPHGSGLGRVRYVVERTLAWLGNYRRLKLCYERTGAHFQAFHDLAVGLICANKLREAG
jgi:transposase